MVGRSLLEFSTNGDDIPRLDVTDGFEEYKGGFDPDEEAYIGSLGEFPSPRVPPLDRAELTPPSPSSSFGPDNETAFLALPGVVLTALSLLVPILFFVFRCLCCSWRKNGGCWPTARERRGIACAIISVMVFSLFILAGSVIVYIYGAEATAAVDDFCDSLIKNTKLVLGDFVKVNDGIVAAQQKLGTNDIGGAKVVVDLAADAAKLTKDVDDFQSNLKDTFEIVDLAFLIAACVFLFFGLINLISTTFKWRSVVIILTLVMPLISVIAWACMAVTFPLTSLFADACNEMLVYQTNPDNSTITEYIPCPDKQTSTEALEEAYENLNEFAAKINLEVVKVNSETQAGLDACAGLNTAVCDNVRAKARTLDQMCVPFVDCTLSSTAACANPGRETKYAPSACPYPTAANKVSLQKFSDYFEPYSCENDDVNGCRLAGRPITRSDFTTMTDNADGAADLLTILPETESLITCKFVEVTLRDLTTNYCKDCVETLDTLWIGFLLVGIGLFVNWFIIMSAQAKMIKSDAVGFEIEMGTPK